MCGIDGVCKGQRRRRGNVRCGEAKRREPDRSWLTVTDTHGGLDDIAGQTDGHGGRGTTVVSRPSWQSQKYCSEENRNFWIRLSPHYSSLRLQKMCHVFISYQNLVLLKCFYNVNYSFTCKPAKVWLHSLAADQQPHQDRQGESL